MKKSGLERAIEQFEAEIKVTELALAKLKALQSKVTTRKSRLRAVNESQGS